jgi:hypothetical protein
MDCMDYPKRVKALAARLDKEAGKYIRGRFERKDIKRTVAELRFAVSEVERSYGLRGRA